MEVASPIPKKHARIEIIPLIDIMFFLLASFMMVSLSQTTMKGMKVNVAHGHFRANAVEEGLRTASRLIAMATSTGTRPGLTTKTCR